MALEALIHALGQARAYPWSAEGQVVEVIQTHISVVFLIGREVFKIHKPVDFGFLNFTTLEARRRDCEAELAINQELAPGVYLGLAAVVRDPDGQLVVQRELPEDSSAVIEWAVWMRRLPDSATFEHLLAHGRLARPQLWTLATTLADFHGRGAAEAAAHPELTRYGDRETVVGNARENFEQLEALLAAAKQAGRPPPIDKDLLAQLRQATEAELTRVQELIHERHQRGMVRDTHGDLRLDHVYHLPSAAAADLDEELAAIARRRELLIIDRIEFTERFRWADPIADVAFLIMDLQARGAWALARCFADDYLRASGDAEGEQLLPFYTGYRATVRAKVAAMAAAEPELGASAQRQARAKAEARARLALVELSPPRERPCLLLLAGLPGSGKSVLARGLRETMGFVWIRADEVRKRLAGMDPFASGRGEVDQGIYTRDWSDRTYEACLQRAADVCLAGGRALVDATFIDGERRRTFVEAAIGWGVPAHMLEVYAPEALVRTRLAARTGDPSDADWQVYLAARERWSPIDPMLCRFGRVDAAGTPGDMLEDALRALGAVGLA